MNNQILLGNEPYNATETELPCLITYGDKMGGSHMSVTLIANLFLQGSKILFLTAYPMAKENFLEQVGLDHSEIVFVDTLSELDQAKNTRAIMLESGNEVLFLEVAKKLSDLHERVVFIKNMEVFSEPVIDICLGLEKVILSGNIDTCIAKEKILQKHFQTIIAFNQPEISFPLSVSPMEKYCGFLLSNTNTGIISIKK